MKITFLPILAVSLSTLMLSACNTDPKLEEAQYWQRKNATSALYLRGPKAQQMLHMDIATCTNEIAELDRVGALREAIPADTQNGRINDPKSSEGRLSKWESPKRDGYLYNEYLPYHDFEGCMDAKGWERVENLPYQAADTARKEYLKTVYGYEFQNRYGYNTDENAKSPADSYDPEMSVNK